MTLVDVTILIVESFEKFRVFRLTNKAVSYAALISFLNLFFQVDSTTNMFDSLASTVSHSSTEEQSSFFPTEISSINNNDLFNRNNPNNSQINFPTATIDNKHSCQQQQQQVHYQILKCTEIN
jgi:hypothetical protein